MHAHVYEFVCSRARARVRACVFVDVHLSVAPRAPACVLCIVFIIPTSVSAKLKFCIALCIYGLRGYCCP